MKEVTKWDNNPRMMWVWDYDPKDAVKRKVVYIRSASEARLFNVITIGEKDETMNTKVFGHCAEIEKRRLMTNKELARWLSEKPGRECMSNSTDHKWVSAYWSYPLENADTQVSDDICVREDGGPWFTPFVEEVI